MALLPHVKWNDVELGGSYVGRKLNPIFRKRHGLHKHATASEIKAIVGDDFWFSATRFALVRDPIERAASTFHYLKKWRAWIGADIMDKFNTPSDFVCSDLFMTPGPGRMFRPQKFWLDAEMSFTGMTSDIAGALLTVQQETGIPIDGPGVHNASERKAHNFTPEAMARLHNRYSADMAMLRSKTEQPAGC